MSVFEVKFIFNVGQHGLIAKGHSSKTKSHMGERYQDHWSFVDFFLSFVFVFC